MSSFTYSAPRRSGGRRRALTVASAPGAPYAISPARRVARILLASGEIQGFLRRIESSAKDSGIILGWNHEANALREWRCGLRVFMAERDISPPLCLHGRSGFLTREECESKLVAETIRGKKCYKFVCKHNLDEEDCFYEAPLDTSPAMALHRRVFNPSFSFEAPPEYLYTYADYLEDDEDDEGARPTVPPGLATFARETPTMPIQAMNTAGLIETRALVALNSASGLHIDYLPSLHRLLQHCKYCDIVALPAAMRDHIRTGCGIVQYCSKDCQRRDWKASETPHKAVCALLKRLAPLLELSEGDFRKRVREINITQDELALMWVNIRHGNVPVPKFCTWTIPEKIQIWNRSPSFQVVITDK
ncbi:hypothetical protein EXIGLDRAFT_705944 [Exidia glandulosa HHB12029]|uniref:MYND-type domain-containing protein n=1 Tax=Exidia glandulosa HHB12029 TaxID=1314781 RepID=A0A165Z775_EXIGL|nr:hypothetical protein EXIGLDRAFT_705944 [Exidia glandulosa HHB12029]